MSDVAAGGDKITSIVCCSRMVRLLQRVLPVIWLVMQEILHWSVINPAVHRQQLLERMASNYGCRTKVFRGQKCCYRMMGRLSWRALTIIFMAMGYLPSFIVARYNKDGSPNTHFGENGIQVTDFGRSADYAYDALLQPDGKIVVVGFIEVVQNPALVRYNGDQVEKPWFAKIKKWLHKHGFTWDDFPHLAGNAVTVERSANGTIFNPIATLTTHRRNQSNNYFEDPAL